MVGRYVGIYFDVDEYVVFFYEFVYLLLLIFVLYDKFDKFILNDRLKEV